MRLFFVSNGMVSSESKNFINLFFWQNRRPDYISTFMEKLVSWEAVSARLEKAKALAAEREMEEERRKKEEEEEKQTDDDAVEIDRKSVV